MKVEKLEIKYTRWDEARSLFIVITVDDILMQLYRIALNASSDYTYKKNGKNCLVNIYDIEKATKRVIYVQEGYVVSDIQKSNLEEIKTILEERGYLKSRDNKFAITQTGIEKFDEIRKMLLSKAFRKSDGPLNNWIEVINGISKTSEVFLSYCREDSELANQIDSLFTEKEIYIKRDTRDIEAWGSVRKYMDSIKDTDYAILIISDAYLKSYNCMYEIRQVLSNSEYKNRIFTFVTSSASSIYKLWGKIEYITYWEQKYEEMLKEVHKIKNIENSPMIIEELRIIKEISFSISEFLHTVSDSNNPLIK